MQCEAQVLGEEKKKKKRHEVFPARAGMNRTGWTRRRRSVFHRAGGDESKGSRSKRRVPRAGGDEPETGLHGEFPARAMRHAQGIDPVFRVPRAGGDEPYPRIWSKCLARAATR